MGMDDIKFQGMAPDNVFNGFQMVPAQVFIPGFCREIEHRCLKNMDICGFIAEINFLGNGKGYQVTYGDDT
jgi:hypothetical protein